MALIKCTECGKEISDSAESCPHCGVKTSHGQTVAQEKGNTLIKYAFTIGFLLLGIILLWSGSSFINEYTSSYWGEYLWESGDWIEDSDAVMAVIKVIAGIGLILGFFIDVIVLLKKANESPSAPVKTIATVLDTPSKNSPLSSSDNYSTQNVPNGSWTCTCGKVHAAYVSSCSCGKNKRDIQ